MPTWASDVPRIEVDNASIHDPSCPTPWPASPPNIVPLFPRPSPTPTVVESSDERSSIGRSSFHVYPAPSATLSTHSTRHSRQSVPSDSEYDHSYRPRFACGTTMQANHRNASSRQRSDVMHERFHVPSNQDEDFIPSPFSFNRSILERLDFERMENLGGTQALLKGLKTDGERGLSKEAHSVCDRIRVYGPNLLPTTESKVISFLMWSAHRNKVFAMLFIAGAASLALGLLQDFDITPQPQGEPPIGWVKGTAIMVAVIIVVIVGSTTDWRREYQSQQFNNKREEHAVNVIRDGAVYCIDSKEVMVGDIVYLKRGEVIVYDGVFLSGNVRCHEAGADGKPREMRKANYEYIKSSSKRSQVLEGVGLYVVRALAKKPFYGRETSPLQQKLNALAEMIAKLGLIIGFALFGTLLIRLFVKIGRSNPALTAREKGIDFVNILIVATVLIVVAVPRSLLLDITFTTNRMINEKLLVRSLHAFESMENISVICASKTGVLTQNKMTVVAGSIGDHAKFDHRSSPNSSQNLTRHNFEDSESSVNSVQEGSAQQTDSNSFSVSRDQLVFVLSLALRVLLIQAIELNSGTLKHLRTGESMGAEDQTEAALLHFAKGLRCGEATERRDETQTIRTIPFSSRHKGKCVVVRLPDGTYRAYFIGASEILLRKSTHHVVVPPPALPRGLEEHSKVETRPMKNNEEQFNETITSYANQKLRTIALCYKDFEELSQDVTCSEEKLVEYSDLAQNLTLIAIIAMEDQLRPGVKDMVERCLNAGVTVKMVTGDHIDTARSLAQQCRIFSKKDGRSMDGSSFRKYTELEQLAIAPRLQVLARSSHEDKEVLVRALETSGQVVLITANGSVLKPAEVDLSLTITGTEITTEASHVTVTDGDFTSILKVITWSRCFNDAARKLLQFQIPTIVTVVVTTFVSAVANSKSSPVLSAVQLLWIHLIMDPFAALAFLTDRPSKTVYDKRPYKKTRPLFTTDMYKQILIQSVYQIAFTLIFHFLGFRILGREFSGNTQDNDLAVGTLVFNAFVFAQIFNMLNCRRLDRKLNIFEGILKNRYILIIILIEISVQTLIIFISGDVFQVRRMTGRDWGISLALGIFSIPLGVLIRFLPNEPFEKAFKKLGHLNRLEALPTVNPGYKAQSNTANINQPELKFFTMIHGGQTRPCACY